MKKTLLICRNEIIQVVARRSFLLVLFAFPLLGFIVFSIAAGLHADPQQPLQEILSPAETPLQEGYVDESGIIEALPPDLQGRLLPYDGETRAAQALQAGQLDGYYIVAHDYLDSGDVTYVRADYNPLGGLVEAGVIEQALRYNLFDGDDAMAARFEQPLVASVVGMIRQEQAAGSDAAVQQRRDPDNLLTFALPYAVTFLLYMVIMGSASLMLNSVGSEKQNRVLEILLTSVTPGQMLQGKMAALALVGLLQTFVWGGSGLLLLRLSGRYLDIPPVFQLPAGVLLWGALFFLLGYALYASLMGGVGALVPNIREASQVTLVIMMPLFIPLILIGLLIQQPDGMLSTVLSIFPLTAPVVMMTRLAATHVPLWQTLLAVVLLCGAVWLVLRSVAALFKASSMLSGNQVGIGGYLKLLLSGGR